MSDIRTHIADALRAHRSRSSYSGGVQCSCGKWKWTHGHGWHDHFADVLLSLPDIAAVELPKPTSTRYEGGEHEPMDRDAWNTGGGWSASVWEYSEVQVSVRIGGFWQAFEPIGIGVARDLAAALLAAAEFAEELGASND